MRGNIGFALKVGWGYNKIGSRTLAYTKDAVTTRALRGAHESGENVSSP